MGTGSKARPSRPRAKKAPKSKLRVRRTAEAAREAILDAADALLDAGGPEAIRLQQIGADTGMSHSAVLHHFGSREGLVEAMVIRALDRMRGDMERAVASGEFEGDDAGAPMRRIVDALRDRGHARLLGWLAVDGRLTNDPLHMLEALARRTHARRVAFHGESDFEETRFAVVLAWTTLAAEGLFGSVIWDSAGLGSDPKASERFHSWLVDVLSTRLSRDATTRAAPSPR